MYPEFKQSIDDKAWEFTGDEENPKARLLATIEINGLSLHLEAIEVKNRFKTQEAADPLWQEQLEYYELAGQTEGIRFTTTEIMGRTYALFATPFCA